MKKTKFINANNLPPRLGIGSFLLWWLFLDRVQAPGWVYGVVGTILVVAYAVQWFQVFVGQGVDLFAESKP